jgi:hypothetical protein
MDHTAFLKRLQDCELKLGREEGEYTKRDIEKYDALTSLFLEASPEQRQKLTLMFAPGDNMISYYRLGYLIAYMRWVSERIRTQDDIRDLRLGLATAALLEERMDTRDIIVSLAFLHHAATQAGIDPAPHFREIADMARPETKAFINAFLERGNREIKEMVDAFRYMQ